MAQSAAPPNANAFRFELTNSGNRYRGPGVEGYLYNALPWKITNVRLRVESLDSSGTVTGESYGWVLGDVAAGGRGYFYLPVPALAVSYRPTVQSFDRVSFDPGPQAP
jgi:hypothetical protein